MGGSSSPATSKPLTGYDTALMRSLRMNNGLVSAAVSAPPEVREADIDYLQATARREAIINALGAKEVERDLSPDVARVREMLPAQIAEDMEGGPNRQLSNLWLKGGLQDAVATGANVDGSFARSAIADSTRADFIDARDKNQAKGAALLADNPQPIVGLDPGSLASAVSMAKGANVDSRENWRTGILNLLGNQNSNLAGAIQQSGQTEAARRANDTNAINAARSENKAFWGNMGSAGIAGGAAIGGAVLVAF